MKRFTLAMTGLYLAVLLVAWGLLRYGSEYWWPVTMLLFAPRWLLATPLLVLVPLAGFVCRAWLPVFALHAAIMLFPIMGLRVNSTSSPAADNKDRPELCVLTCNLGGGPPRVEQLVAVVDSSGADILCLQECERSLADEIFASLGWEFQHRSQLAIGSRCQLSDAEILARHGPGRYHQAAAIACTIELDCFSSSSHHAPASGFATPHERLQVVSIHLPTMRPAIAAMLHDPLGGAANLPEVVDEHRRVSAEARGPTRRWDKPQIVAGDFNMPVDSRVFSEHWGDLQNAFSVAGRGFGRTKFTRLHGVRIDHVLADGSWQVVSAEVGPGVGGDHRPMIVRLVPTAATDSQSQGVRR